MATLMAVSMLAMVLQSPGLAGATTARERGPAGPGSAAGPVIATGMITRDSVPVSGASVMARIWPNGEQLNALPEGAEVDLREVARIRADHDGNFHIALDPVRVPPTHRDKEGGVAVELLTSLGDQHISWHFSAFQPVRGAHESVVKSWSTAAAAAKGSPAPGTFRFDFGSTPSVLDLHDPPSDWVDETGTRMSTSSMALIDGGAQPVDASEFCGGPLEAGPWREGIREHFLNVYAWSGAMATVDQTIGSSSSHTLGIAVRTAQGWSATGSSTLAITQGAGQEMSGIADAAIYNAWNYRDFWGRTTAGPINCAKVVPVNIFDVFNEPFAYARHEYFSESCVAKSPGAILRKNTGENVTHATGVDIGPFSVSAQSGFNEGTEIKWTVTKPSMACSNSREGWPNASQVDLRAAG